MKLREESSARTVMSLPRRSLSQQHRRAGSPGDQTAEQCESRLSLLAAAERIIQGYEAMHMIRKGQVRWLAKGDIAQQVRFIKCIFELTTRSVHQELQAASRRHAPIC